jgi:hypothetical protein
MNNFFATFIYLTAEFWIIRLPPKNQRINTEKKITNKTVKNIRKKKVVKKIQNTETKEDALLTYYSLRVFSCRQQKLNLRFLRIRPKSSNFFLEYQKP